MESHAMEPTPRTRRSLRETDAARPRSRRVEVPAAQDVVEVLPVAAHGGASPARRRSTTVVGRLAVLAALAGVTLVVPVTQGLERGEMVLGATTTEVHHPSTVTALTALPLSDLPPTSLVSADGSARLRAAMDVSRAAERSVLPGCDGVARPSGANGQLSTDDLCELWDGRTQIRADAAVALAELNTAYVARFGTDICLTSGYRTLAQQKSVKAQKGGLAATPGKSNHGWGLALDLCGLQDNSTRFAWMNDNAPIYGWENPTWAKRGGSGPYEPWHWEYIKGVKADGEYYG
ncbi:M15 family metallopeptidase [Cellulomonas shaoxiangyii]|uniref:Peptidase M15 n=1 Tax=Cellulomonas shaoxiangyii TaxID=2566013 RepID=A0A4P7SJA8_9CELL|nr:M15 family metallopeptidase [Cellulomonas shaoxiangyii]QCB94170.1 peptidase M15 [Cellulomonas shaoxiangyii]TGY86663.1 peptidase M15 [Cellulomonas shaoxiangyii]